MWYKTVKPCNSSSALTHDLAHALYLDSHCSSFWPVYLSLFVLCHKMTSVVVIAGVITNILSVVGIVITNKYITEVDGFHFMVFLSFLHFLFTTIGTRVMLMMGLFSYQPAPLSGILPVATGSLLSVAFMNLNLSYNSVGFYQVCCHRTPLLCVRGWCLLSVDLLIFLFPHSCRSWHVFRSHCSCSMSLTSSPFLGWCSSH